MGNRVFCLGMLAAALMIVGCGSVSSSGGNNTSQETQATPNFPSPFLQA
jgi:hypothetical protein